MENGKAIILSAGQGTRLLPLTADMPKCLIKIDGKAILDHQLDALAAAGVAHPYVVGGYRFEKLAAHIAARGDGTDLLFNPFWLVASSISSVWAARALLEGDFVILNGDTIYAANLLAQGFAGCRKGISLFVQRVDTPELDDMLVEVEDGVVRAVGKTLAPARARYRSLGIIAGRQDEGQYRAALDTVIAREGGILNYHHAIIGEIAQNGTVQAIVVNRDDWIEIDRPEDIAAWHSRGL
ncbi:nucleotidyl transferase [Sphingobium sp. SCG-1]|uniref:phosphocholine cytidylyltransferase family protein n=1 Tax=Sphingobium sp. SCG-1 TaxID=2072936 RepID=UPI000CD6C17E|nr:sugar phosphate nucleotidyltransferase [Sphingobium sp. SCG-1]AUW60105.1 nucleotidyl transferase [Sphingobium sp. SCG-1]